MIPSTTEEIIQDFTGKSDIEISQFIYDIAKDNHKLETKNKKWLSADEVKEILEQDYPDIKNRNDRKQFIDWKENLRKELGLSGEKR